MGLRSKRVCRVPGCNRLTRNKSGYCDEHEKGHRAAKGDTKAADAFYLSSRWRKIRAMYLREFPLCELCRQEGKVVVASVVHHKKEIKDGGDPYAFENLQAVCPECHNRLHGKR